jgi:hypothetical protein
MTVAPAYDEVNRLQRAAGKTTNAAVQQWKQTFFRI